MNVLLFVTALLMALAIATYAQLESFLDLARLRQQHHKYMAIVEHRYHNDQQHKFFDDAHDPRGKGKADVDGKSNNSNGGSGEAKLDVAFLVKAEQQQSEKGIFASATLKRLINIAYGNAPFFREALEQDPDLVDHLISSVMDKGAPYAKEHGIPNAKDLAQIDLGNETLQKIWYHMVKGAQDPTGDANDPGYRPLSDFVNVNRGKKLKLSIASPEVLLAVFEDPAIVTHMLQERAHLQAQIREDKLETAAATKLFEDAFGSYRPQDKQFLDYTVSGSK